MPKAKILIVEDERIVAKDIANILKSKGYVIPAIVSTGEEAIEKIRQTEPDLILMDIMLKGKMDGIEAAAQIRNRFNKPVIFITALMDKKILQRAKMTEPYAYIVKPFRGSELYTNIEMALYKHRMESELKESEERYRDLVEKADVAVLIDDKQGRFKYFNKKFLELFGYSYKDMKKNSFESLVHPDDIDRIKQFHKERTRGANAHNNYEFKGVKKDGSTVCLEVHVVALKDGDEIIGTRSYLRDISERKRAEEELRAQSLKDELTGLNNRRGFFILAQQQLKLAKRKKMGFYLFFADLDGMKWINDNLGHHEGDKALKEIADVFRKTFRESDIIARMGGDEFAILAIEAQKDSVETLSDRLLKRLKDFNKEQKYSFELSLSIGVVYYDPEHPAMIGKMLEQADKLMYEHKQSKKKMVKS